MSKTFLYLCPPARKSYYKTRNESYIITELENRHHSVHVVDKLYSFNSKRYLRKHTVDGVIFNSLKVGYKSLSLLKHFRSLKIPVYWWYFDTATMDSKRRQRVEETAKLTDVFFNKDLSEFNRYKRLGLNPVWLDQGVPSDCSEKLAGEDIFDLGFIGSYHHSHSGRFTLLKDLDTKYKLVIYSPDWKSFQAAGFRYANPPITQTEIGPRAAQTKIMLVLHSEKNGPYCWSDRIHLMIGSGAFCLVDHLPGLEESYLPEKHCIYFNGSAQLIEKIDYYLDKSRNRLRRQVAGAGYHWAHEQHSYAKRVNGFLEQIQ